jgi:DegV family protein with EDD domain
MNITLVTDSTADIPEDLIEAYRIQVVPNILVIDGVSLMDGIDITREEFYENLPTMQKFPTTSTASVGKYEETYRRLLQQGTDYILSLHVSKNLSGIYNAACTAAEAFPGRVRVIDSKQLTLGLGFQVLAAAEAIRNQLDLDGVMQAIFDVQRRVIVIAMLDTLEYVARSGRVSWARARIGNLLRIKPFLKVWDGEVIRLGDVRTRQKGIEKLKEILYSLGEIDRLGMLHTNAKADAENFLKGIEVNLPIPPVLVNVTTVIGAHVGPKGLGFTAVIKNIQ